MKKDAKAVGIILSQPVERWRLLFYWFLVLSFLLIFPNIGLVWELFVNQHMLSVQDKLAMVLSLYTNTIRFLFNPVTFTTVTLSLLLAINFVVIGFIRRHIQKMGTKTQGMLAIVVSSHCVACGSSLVAPLISLFAGSANYFSSSRYLLFQAVALLVNIVAIAITLYSIKRATNTVRLWVVQTR